MSGLALRLAGGGLLILLGIVVGTWATGNHFGPALDDAQNRATQCTAARDNLAGLANEQSRALGDMALAANARQARAGQAINEAKASAGTDYAAANRLQQERIGGEQCAAAASIIDRELGL